MGRSGRWRVVTMPPGAEGVAVLDGLEEVDEGVDVAGLEEESDAVVAAKEALSAGMIDGFRSASNRGTSLSFSSSVLCIPNRPARPAICLTCVNGRGTSVLPLNLCKDSNIIRLIFLAHVSYTFRSGMICESRWHHIDPSSELHRRPHIKCAAPWAVQ